MNDKQETTESEGIVGQSASTGGLELMLLIEKLARADVGEGLDWNDLANIGATAMQRAAFRRGFAAGVKYTKESSNMK
jgi:hypothetical protein